MLAIKLMEDIKDDNKKDEMRKKPIIAIMSRRANGKEFVELVESPAQAGA